MSKDSFLNLSTTAFAYMGDGVYEVFVRRKIIDRGQVHADGLHKIAIKYVSAKGQAKAIKAMQDILTEEEKTFVRRSRNKKVTTKAKNVDMMTYKWATAFESLIGYLYLTEDEDRLNFLMEKAMEAIDE